MSLDFDTSKIANREEVTTSPFDKNKWHPVTNALIWATMAVEMGEITEANAEEFARRLSLWQTVNGAWLEYNDGEAVYLTLEDVKLHIGLKTNVFPMMKPKQFAEKLVKLMEDRAKAVKNRDGLSAHKLTLYRAFPEVENIGSVKE